ncbi:hypothetical protein [Jannaschia sp. LMIT008]|uniref:hypothetical protein n=1 Tax=Jannaschia maritima TaxID=3032585 RepID=UPI0028116747|nr:hypothetical protein [Jannaschia sp. LMIT008]
MPADPTRTTQPGTTTPVEADAPEDRTHPAGPNDTDDTYRPETAQERASDATMNPTPHAAAGASGTAPAGVETPKDGKSRTLLIGAVVAVVVILLAFLLLSGGAT